MEKMTRNILIDERSLEAINKFPRKISMSALIRCLLKAATTPDEKEWNDLLEEEPDLKKARNTIKEYLKSTGRMKIAL